MPNRIKYYRKQCGLTQRQLAARIYCCVNSLSSWENGHKIPGVNSALLLARALGVRVEDLFGEDNHHV